jgi:RNase P/RNase MRP subunit p30
MFELMLDYTEDWGEFHIEGIEELTEALRFFEKYDKKITITTVKPESEGERKCETV